MALADEITEVRAALLKDGVPEAEITAIIALMSKIPDGMEAPDTVHAFWKNVGTVCNAMWQAKYNALNRKYEESQAALVDANTELGSLKASHQVVVASRDSLVKVVRNVRAALGVPDGP